MIFRLEIENVRPVVRLVLEIDLDRHGLMCIVGKNGSGKTTLAKAMMNLALADTFLRTSTTGVFDSSSTINYKLEEDEYLFTYDDALGTVSTRKLVSAEHKGLVTVELPVPHGQRFTFFRTLAEKDDDIRRAVVLGQYQTPTELIGFLSRIYGDDRFINLVEVHFNGGACCCLVQPDQRYIREDYFSSGEYFLINLYRKISKGTPLIFIDEIDISLDAQTQARLAEQLRLLCKQHRVTLVFTSHSLALMQTLESDELHYLERTEEETVLMPMSFNVVKSLMFNFKGWDRYILTEDDRLKQFLEFAINHYCSPVFFSHQIISAGGAGQAVGLMNKNDVYKFLGPADQVICVLDGDKSSEGWRPRVHYIPFANVEQALWDEYRRPDFLDTFSGGNALDAKALYKSFTKSKRLVPDEIFRLLCDRHNTEMDGFVHTLKKFLCRPVK